MGDRFVDLLLTGMKRLHVALGRFWKRTTPPPAGGQNEICTDPW